MNCINIILHNCIYFNIIISKLEAANDTSKTDEVNSKLKKTISERDLLIREYKKSKDSVAKFEISVKEKDDQLAGIADVHKKELKKIQDQVNALENTAKVSGKGDKAKDKIIAVCINNV